VTIYITKRKVDATTQHICQRIHLPWQVALAFGWDHNATHGYSLKFYGISWWKKQNQKVAILCLNYWCNSAGATKRKICLEGRQSFDMDGHHALRAGMHTRWWHSVCNHDHHYFHMKIAIGTSYLLAIIYACVVWHVLHVP
jgi:hypothetical protein